MCPRGVLEAGSCGAVMTAAWGGCSVGLGWRALCGTGHGGTSGLVAPCSSECHWWGKWELQNTSGHVQVHGNPKQSYCLPCKSCLVFQWFDFCLGKWISSDWALELAWLHSVLCRKLIVLSLFWLPSAFCYRKFYLAFDYIYSNVISGGFLIGFCLVGFFWLGFSLVVRMKVLRPKKSLVLSLENPSGFDWTYEFWKWSLPFCCMCC